MKARYRRGMALRHLRKFLEARQDLQACLILSPGDPQIKSEVHQTFQEFRRTTTNATTQSHDPSTIPHVVNPDLNDVPIPVPGADDSDSSDFEHEGNGTPCQAYNRDGCKLGSKCELQHAPPKTGDPVKAITTRDELYVSQHHAISSAPS
ncbi:hypothetical protein GYMLUDRAFT_367034 [Collybiopsis luxurians FD-317 M1]|nr:hypothetical protein GYMLUDRAFT_367034 [Collybiopsis luxurians FD-317 M1]